MTGNNQQITYDWVLLRGLSRGSFYWHRFPALLQDYFPGHRFYLPDLAGNGLRFQETSPKTIQAIVENYRAVLPTSNSPKNIIALSLGGMAGLQWMHKYPHEVDQLIVINTSAGGISRVNQRIQAKALKQLLLAKKTNLEAFERAVLQLTSTTQQNNDELLFEWVKHAKSHSVNTANGLRQLWAAARFSLPDITLNNRKRITIVQGLGDKLVDPTCGQQLAKKLGCEHWIHPSAGHDLTLDAGEWLAERIREKLAKQTTE